MVTTMFDTMLAKTMITTTRRVATVLGIGLAAALAGCATTEATMSEKGVKPLDQKALQETFATRPSAFTWSNERGLSGTVSYRPDGTLSASWAQGSDSGTYRITPEGQLCTRWKQIRGGAESCDRVYAPEPQRYLSFAPDRSNVTELRPVR
jgi:hypothetical protein